MEREKKTQSEGMGDAEENGRKAWGIVIQSLLSFRLQITVWNGHVSISTIQGTKEWVNIRIIFVRQRVLSSIFHLLVVRRQEFGVDSNLRWSQSWRCDKLEGGVTDELPGQPQERFLEVVVRFGGNIVVL